jgi:ADP-ribose pyrophosphatase YjhB (NUDIX family)
MTLDPGRAALLAELERYGPSDDGERAMAERLRAFVAAHPDCFERTHLAGHVTGSAWVVDRAGEAAVLTHHRKLGKWLQLGGHADGDSDIRRVSRREAVEESGLAEIESANDGIYDVDVHEIPARDMEPAHVHYDVRFAFYADRGALPAASEESHAVAWIPLAEIERFAIDDSVRRLVAKTPSLFAGPIPAAVKSEPL